jgi:hypothetical protein
MAPTLDAQIQALELLVRTMDAEDPTFEVLNAKLKAFIEQKKTATPKPQPPVWPEGPAESWDDLSGRDALR